MNRVPSASTVDVRSYRPEDETRVLDLLNAALGGGPAGWWSAEFFRWKHLANPFGPSFILVAEADGRIVGLRAFMRWRFEAGDRTVTAVRAVDTATHPDYQGRGIFSRLTLEALDALRAEVDLVFNTPNEKSLPGYLKMGWRMVGKIPISIRIRRPLRFFRMIRYRKASLLQPSSPPPVLAESAANALQDGSALAGLLEEAPAPRGLLATPRSVEYLRWRYGEASGLGYHAVSVFEGRQLRGLAIFRIRPRGPLWESTVAEAIVDPGDPRAARWVFQRVTRSAPVDHVACHLQPGTATVRGARLAGFLRAPGGITFVANPLLDDFRPDPTDLSSWALSLGDLEVF
jgi:GNAT superfamily N-acetyltransferase